MAKLFVYGCGLTNHQILSIRKKYDDMDVSVVNDPASYIYTEIEYRFNLLGLIREIKHGDMIVFSSMFDIFIDFENAVKLILFILTRRHASVSFWKEREEFSARSNLKLIRIMSEMIGTTNQFYSDDNPYDDIESTIINWGTHFALDINKGKITRYEAYNKTEYKRFLERMKYKGEIDFADLEEESESDHEPEPDAEPSQDNSDGKFKFSKEEKDKLMALYKRSIFPISSITTDVRTTPDIEFKNFKKFFDFNIPRDVSTLSENDIEFVNEFYPRSIYNESLIPADIIRNGKIPYGSYKLIVKVPENQNLEIYPVEYQAHYVITKDYQRYWKSNELQFMLDHLYEDRLNNGPDHLLVMGTMQVTIKFNNGIERTGYGEFGFRHGETSFLETTKVVSPDFRNTDLLTTVGRQYLKAWTVVETLLRRKEVKIIVESHKEFDDTTPRETKRKDPIEGQENLFDNMNVREMIDKAIQDAERNSPVEYTNTRTVHLRLTEALEEFAMYQNVSLDTNHGTGKKKRKLLWPVIGHDVHRKDNAGVVHTYWRREHYRGPLAPYFNIECPPSDIQKAIETRNVTIAQMETPEE